MEDVKTSVGENIMIYTLFIAALFNFVIYFYNYKYYFDDIMKYKELRGKVFRYFVFIFLKLVDAFIIISWFRLLYNNEKDIYIQSILIFILHFILNIIFQALYLNYISKELKEKNDNTTSSLNNTTSSLNNDNIINKNRLKIDKNIYLVSIILNNILLLICIIILYKYYKSL